MEQLESTISSDEKQKIESLVSELEELVKKEDYPAMKNTTEQLKKAMMEIGEKVYKESGTSNSTEDEVIETDFSSEK